MEPSHKAHILVVDDEWSIVAGLTQNLLAEGYKVSAATGGRQALTEIAQNRPDLVILDLMMPDLDGLEVIKATRLGMGSEVPIIVLSARGEEQKKVEALDFGANDYLTKPFGLEELLARVRVALRYKTSRGGNNLEKASALSSLLNSPSAPNWLGNWQLAIDLDGHRVLREGIEVKLTPKQFELLSYLAQNVDKLLTHKLLLQKIWGSQHNRQNEYLHVFIGQLRQRIEPNPARPHFIITEPGLGYRFRLPEASPVVSGGQGEDLKPAMERPNLSQTQ
jgi:two-component system KDP operon response regulator KdpE